MTDVRHADRIRAIELDAVDDRRQLLDHVRECDQGRVRNDRAHGWLFALMIGFGSTSLGVAGYIVVLLFEHLIGG